jgi:hypothetical protein
MTRGILLAAMMIAGLVAPRTAAAQTPAAWLGTWVLNVEKSTYNPGPAPYKRGTFTVEPWKDGVRLVSDLVGVRGGVTHYEWTGRFDGQDYPLQGIEEDLTYSYAPVDARTVQLVIKVAGTTVARARSTISADGRMMTTVTSGVGPRGETITTTTVYEKTAGGT